MPWALIVSAANILSRPPEKTQIAFITDSFVYNPSSFNDSTRDFCSLVSFFGTAIWIST